MWVDVKARRSNRKFRKVLFNQPTILDKMLEHGSQDRATLPFPPSNVGLENPNDISCRLYLTTLQGEGSGKGWWCFNDFCQ